MTSDDKELLTLRIKSIETINEWMTKVMNQATEDISKRIAEITDSEIIECVNKNITLDELHKKYENDDIEDVEYDF